MFPDDDLALLRTVFDNVAFAPLSGEARMGHPLIALGYPRQRDRELFDQFGVSYEGQTQFLDASGRAGVEAKFKAGQVEPGYSGGPLLNLRTGRVIGVVVASRNPFSDLGGWAIEISVLEKRLEEQGIQLPPVDPQWTAAQVKQHADDVTVIVGALEARYKDQLETSRTREAADREQLAAYREQLAADREQLKALSAAVTALTQQRTQPDAPPGIDDALAELAQGNTEAAEALFQAVADRKAADVQEAAAALRHLGALAFLHDTPKALRAYRRAVAFDPEDVEGWIRLGYLLVRIGQLDEAVGAYRKVLALGEETGDRSFMARAYGSLGTVYLMRGDLAQAEALYRKALELQEALGNEEGMARTYGYLGIVYRMRGDLAQAEAMFGKALELMEALRNKSGIAHVSESLGIVCRMRGDLAQAEALHCKALELAETLGDKAGMVPAYSSLGSVYGRRGDLAQAEAMFGKALALAEVLGHKAGMAGSYASLGRVYQKRGDLGQAKAMYRKALILFQEISAAPHVKQVQILLRMLGVRTVLHNLAALVGLGLLRNR
jgi:tetratricopeptide (TPR) repeat protein